MSHPVDRLDPGAEADVRAALRTTTRATTAEATRLRRLFAAWLVLDVGDDDVVDALVLAVYEALANAAEHAYAGSATGPMHLEARRGATTTRVTVTDEGRWRPGRTGRFRGHGLPAMRHLVDAVHIVRDTRGTRVELCTAVGPVAGR